MKVHDHAVLEVCVSGPHALRIALRLLWDALWATLRGRTVTFMVEDEES